MQTILLKELKQLCGGCPTSYEGKTIDGKEFYCRLRHGFMRIDVDDETILSGDVSGNDLDGVCDWMDFKKFAARNGLYLMEEL